jgi:predicted  nucleic acid-binding Zn-ribbon protein
VPQRLLKKKLADTSLRLRQLQEELKVAEEQLVHFSDEADEARLRSLVSETPLADQKHREANKHAESMRKHKNMLQTEIERVEALQDELLDQMDSNDA